MSRICGARVGTVFSADAAAASALAVRAGNDLCSGTTYKALIEAVERGLIQESTLDLNLRRLFKLRFQLGQFDPAAQVPYRRIPIEANASDAHDLLAYRTAAESLVLLKNNGILPIDPQHTKTVAILGPTGFEASTVLGNYSGTPRKLTTLTEALRSRFESAGMRVLTAPAVPLVEGFRVDGKPFPAGVLRADATGEVLGLSGMVFANSDLAGDAVTNRIDAQISLQWDEAQPIEGLPNRDTSIRWSGLLVPEETGLHTFSVEVEGSVRLVLDGQVVIDSWKPRDERKISAQVSLEAGHQHTLVLEYAHTRQQAHIHLGWKTPNDLDDWNDAMDAAREADVIVLTLGLTPDLEGESMTVNAEGFLGGDRTSIALPATQRHLLEVVHALDKPVVLLLTTGSAVSFDPEKTNAALVCWYYGQQGGAAIADTLLGQLNPAGRLPVTFYRDVQELPAFEDYTMRNRTYRYYSGEALFPFGHGLSYTGFEYLSGCVSAIRLSDQDTLDLEVTLKNTGRFEGDEVIQVYARALQPPVDHADSAIGRFPTGSSQSRRGGVV